MFDLILRFIKFLLPILRTSVIQVAADTLTDLAYPRPTRRFSPRTNYNQRPRGYTDTVKEPNPFPAGTANHLRHHYGLPPVETGKAFHDVLMVAFDITGPNAGLVYEWLESKMPHADRVYNTPEALINLDSWWIADDNADGDLDSAVFVPKGRQEEARQVLRENGLYE